MALDDSGDDEIAVITNKLKLFQCFLCNATISQFGGGSVAQTALNALQTVLHYTTAHLDYLVKVTVVDIAKASAGNTPSKDSSAAAAQQCSGTGVNSPKSGVATGATVPTMLIYLAQSNINE